MSWDKRRGIWRILGKKKMPCAKRRRTFYLAIYQLHSAGDLTRTEASGADVHVSGSPIHNRLHALHVGLPGAVGAAVGVGDLDTEGDALVAEFTFGHVAYLLAMRVRFR